MFPDLFELVKPISKRLDVRGRPFQAAVCSLQWCHVRTGWEPQMRLLAAHKFGLHPLDFDFRHNLYIQYLYIFIPHLSSAGNLTGKAHHDLT